MNQVNLIRQATLCVLLSSTLGLTGCWAKLGYSCAEGLTCANPKIGVEGGTGSGPPPGGAQLMAALAIDASALYINTNGTDYNVGATGNAAITLFDSSGTIIAAKAFAWVRSGTTLVFQNPTAVQNWVNSYPTASDADATVDAGTVPADGISHVLATTLVYQGVQQASASRSFAAQCIDPRTNRRYLCSGN